MKQVNLIPKKIERRQGLGIHPFWKRFFLLILFFLFLTFIFHTMLYSQIQGFNEQLASLKGIADHLSEEILIYNQLENEREQLEQWLNAQDDRLTGTSLLKARVPATLVLRSLIEAMPNDVWLRNVDCDYEEAVLTVDGMAKTKTIMQAFVNTRLKAVPVFSDILLHTVNVSQVDQTVAFSFTCRLHPVEVDG
jgi:Tfp pilus assembly protein PilN